MTRPARVAATLVAALTAACATTGKFKANMDSWLGGDVNRAIMQFGAPSNTYKLPNGSTMFTWLWVGNSIVTTNYSAYLNLVTTTSTTMWCQVSFTADGTGRVAAWQARGNDCRSR